MQDKWDRASADQTATQLAKNQEDAAKLRTLEGIKNENLAKIDDLRAINAGLRMRLPKTYCRGSSPTVPDIAARTGEFSDKSESDLAEAKRQLDDEAKRADTIVENCRVLNDAIK